MPIVHQSIFKASLSLCGLSQSEAAVFFDVRLDTIKSWCRSRARPPLGVWQMLATRMRAILDAADYGANYLELEGIDPRAWSNLSVSLGPEDDLDMGGEAMAGALALLMAVDDLGR